MGYTTDFDGCFKVEPALEPKHREYLDEFAASRRIKRDPDKASWISDPVRALVGLPVGPEGGYFVGGQKIIKEGYDNSVMDYNRPPESQPGLWCQWVPNDDGTAIEWDQSEKFYDYAEWIEYLIEHFLKPWGYKLNGTVHWYGEEQSDLGKIVIKDNEVQVMHGEITYR